jgi:hypothetical protein
MTTAQVPAWLPEPTIEFYADGRGRTESAYITLREGKAVRAVQPSPEHLAFFYLGADDLPVGLRLLEPVLGAVGTEILFRLVMGADGSPLGVDRQLRYTFIPLDRLDATLHQLKAANERLLEAGGR